MTLAMRPVEDTTTEKQRVLYHVEHFILADLDRPTDKKAISEALTELQTEIRRRGRGVARHEWDAELVRLVRTYRDVFNELLFHYTGDIA
jgi:hypothetical protein